MHWVDIFWSVILFLIFIAIVLIAVFFTRRTESLVGGPCSTNGDCTANTYCSGKGTCIAEIIGGTTGALCNIDEDCQVGLSCLVDNNSTLIPKKDDVPPHLECKIKLFYY